MIKLLQHQWKAIRRSPNWSKSVMQTIFVGFFALYFLLMALGFGFAVGHLIEEKYPDKNSIEVFSAFFILYLLFDLLFRFIMQKFPSVALHKYITLNIPKATLSHFVIVKSLFHFFNFLPLFTVVPFFFLFVLPAYGSTTAFSWLISIFLFIILNNLLSYYIERQLGKNPILGISFLSMISVLLFLEYKGFINVLPILENSTNWIFFNWITTLVLIAIVITMYYILFRFLRMNAYLVDNDSVSQNNTNLTSFSVFSRFGDIGKWMQLESKLIWRNKKPKYFLITSVLFILYPFLIGIDQLESGFFSIFLGIFVTGIFAMNYGTLLIAWNSTHFNLILTQNFPLRKYLKSKYYLLALSCVLLSLMALPYGFFSLKFLGVIIAMCLFNIGVTIPIYMFLAVYSSKRIDLKNGNMFSYEGMSASHFIVILPIIIIPVLINYLFKIFVAPYGGIIFLGIIGVIGIILHQKIIDMVIHKFQERKYILQSNLSTKQ